MSEPWHKAAMVEQDVSIPGVTLSGNASVRSMLFGPLCGAEWVAGKTRQHPMAHVVTCEACIAKMRESANA